MENLSKEEIDILVDALEAWEVKDNHSRLMTGLFKAMLLKDAPDELKREADIKEKQEEDKYEQDKRERKETSLILKAKLIGMKQQLLLDAVNKLITK